MDMNKQIVTEEDLIAFIGEDIEPFKTEEQAAVTDEDEKDYIPEYVSEEEVARENGCWIDDDGHWIPMDYDDEFYW